MNEWWIENWFNLIQSVGIALAIGSVVPAFFSFLRKRVERKEKQSEELRRQEKQQEFTKTFDDSIEKYQQMINDLEQDKNAQAEEILRLNGEISAIRARQRIIEIQQENLNGAKEYFDISKRQAKRSFTCSVVFSSLGFVLLASAVIFAFTKESFQAALVPTIGAAIAEFIAAAVFWVHNKSAQQLNRYYDSLHEVEIFLSSVYVVEQVSTDARDATYAKILDELFNIQKIKAAKHDNPKDKEG
ncbi:MAG: hypothetical protein LBB75_09670 [Oscillospiraceae bacterium]|jgi:hypothetical protein|nr:hypothetical protein [Oscillospiraceae bacterium]